MTPSGPHLTAARQVADAVLYEGYLLYPYRASSAKNQVRWQFGILGPDGAAARGVGEPPAMSAEAVLDHRRGATVDVHLRFLQVQSRVVERRRYVGWEPVDSLLVGDTHWVPFHEAAPREISLPGLTSGSEHVLTVSVPGGQEIEELYDEGILVGRLVRTRWALTATVTATPRPGADARSCVLRILVRNTTAWAQPRADGWRDRDVAARYSLVGTHLILTAAGADFVSMLDPPGWASADVATCRQDRCWPVLIADDEGRDAVLVAPIILDDHPTIAPESAGDLFDATEIDEILTLRIQTMTETEKADARGTDPRAAAILARSDMMTNEAFDLLHGARRPVGDEPVRDERAEAVDFPTLGSTDGDVEVPWWDVGQDARAQPETDAVLVGGIRVAQGSRVLLRPTRPADAQDIFLAGHTAVVARVYFDVDGNTHVAVMLEDDPGSDLYGATGRFYYFAPDEVVPLPARTDEEASR
ncbi:MAG: hypothetical protein JWM93_2400 [Frankiales bacterium]|nr:hypothetical protein [Frankiales bacterium]